MKCIAEILSVDRNDNNHEIYLAQTQMAQPFGLWVGMVATKIATAYGCSHPALCMTFQRPERSVPPTSSYSILRKLSGCLYSPCFRLESRILLPKG